MACGAQGYGVLRDRRAGTPQTLDSKACYSGASGLQDLKTQASGILRSLLEVLGRPLLIQRGFWVYLDV